jgi:hypothetical protein
MMSRSKEQVTDAAGRACTEMASRQAGCARLASGIVHERACCCMDMLLRPTPTTVLLRPPSRAMAGTHTRTYCNYAWTDRVKESRGGAGKRSEREAVAMSYSGACSTTHTSLVELLLMLGAAGAAPTSIAASHVRRAQSLEKEYICRSSNK